MGNYNKNGYYISRQLLSEWEIDFVVDDMRKVVEQQSGKEDIFEGLQNLLNRDIALYLPTVRLCSMLTSLRKLFTHGKIEGKVRDFGIDLPAFQTDPVFHIMSDKLRVDGGYFGFEAHQDYKATGASLNGIVVWIPLTDIDVDLYPLEIIPGSHKEGLYEGFIPGIFEKVTVKKGDVVFMSVFLVHRTCTEGNGGLRMSASIRYEDCSDPEFIKRGYPCKYIRGVKNG